MLGDYDWRLSEKNVWKVERVLLDLPHRAIRSSDARIDRLRARYRRSGSIPGRKPIYYAGDATWTECRGVPLGQVDSRTGTGKWLDVGSCGLEVWTPSHPHSRFRTTL